MAFFKEETNQEIEINYTDIETLRLLLAKTFPKESLIIIRFDTCEEFSSVEEIFEILTKIKATKLELNFNSTQFSDQKTGMVIGSFLQNANQLSEINFIFSNIQSLPGIDYVAKSIGFASQKLKFNFDFSNILDEQSIFTFTEVIRARSPKTVLDLSNTEISHQAATNLLLCLQDNSSFLLYLDSCELNKSYPDLFNQIAEQVKTNTNKQKYMLEYYQI